MLCHAARRPGQDRPLAQGPQLHLHHDGQLGQDTQGWSTLLPGSAIRLGGAPFIQRGTAIKSPPFISKPASKNKELCLRHFSRGLCITEAPTCRNTSRDSSWSCFVYIYRLEKAKLKDMDGWMLTSVPFISGSSLGHLA